MTPTRSDVLAAIKARFPEGEAAAIIDLLDRYGTEPYEREKERVQLAIVELSAGSQERLQSLVQSAKLDYRDVLAWQQLGPLPAAEREKLQNEARGLIEKWGRHTG